MGLPRSRRGAVLPSPGRLHTGLHTTAGVRAIRRTGHPLCQAIFWVLLPCGLHTDRRLRPFAKPSLPPLLWRLLPATVVTRLNAAEVLVQNAPNNHYLAAFYSKVDATIMTARRAQKRPRGSASTAALTGSVRRRLSGSAGLPSSGWSPRGRLIGLPGACTDWLICPCWVTRT
jgi:hypothetical protein